MSDRSDRLYTKILGLLRVHPFPARMAPSIAYDVLASRAGAGLRVLDPMAGSGTALVVARSMGHRATGVDSDPLAVLIAKVWSSDVNPPSLIHLAEEVLEKAHRRLSGIRASGAYPQGVDAETQSFVDYWFDAQNRSELRALADAIEDVRNGTIRALLWCAFSKLIITKEKGASLALDVSHSRPHRVYDRGPILPIRSFRASVLSVLRACPFQGDNRDLPRAEVQLGDARALPFRDASFDVVITSPPYVNAIDYLRGHRLSLVWMGHSVSALRRIRSGNVGTEVSSGERLPKALETAVLARMGDMDQLPPQRRRVLARYAHDLHGVLAEMHRVLAYGGLATLVIGDSTMRGVYVRNSRAALHLAAQVGFRLVSKSVRELPSSRRYMPPPASQEADGALWRRMREETVLTLAK